MSDGTIGIVIGYIGVGIVSLVIICGIISTCIRRDPEPIQGALIASIFLGLLIIVTPLGLGYADRREYNRSYETVLYEKIESVDRGSDTEGHFSIFGGSVDSKIAYYFYVKTEYGYELKEVKVTNNIRIFLVEDNTKTPQVIEKKEVGSYAYIQIIVPVGTVVKEYKG